MDLYDGELIERQNNDSMHSSEGVLIFSNPLLNTIEAVDFLNGFLYSGGELKNSTCQIYNSIEGYILFLKNCFDHIGVKGSVEILQNSYSFKSCPYIELEQLEKKWYSNKRKVVPEFDKTPITLLLSFLLNGHIFEYEQFKSNEYPRVLSKGATIKRTEKNHMALMRLGIDFFSKGPTGLFIKEPDYKKFFTYICEVPFLIPECFHSKFPNEYIQYNKDWVLTRKPE